MAIKVALGGGWRVYLRPEQTQKESGVTVINVLAEAETLVVFGSTASPNAPSQQHRNENEFNHELVNHLLHTNL